MENKFRCEYPGCKKECEHRFRLKLINEENAFVELPFCEYHYFIIMGGHFVAKIIKKCKNLIGEKREQSFKIIGPLKEVEIAEQVMGAREMIAKLKEKTNK